MFSHQLIRDFLLHENTFQDILIILIEKLTISKQIKNFDLFIVERDNRQFSKEPGGEKFQKNLLIPLVIFVLCFLLLVGVIIYQRRLILNKHRQLQCYGEERLGTSLVYIQF